MLACECPGRAPLWYSVGWFYGDWVAPLGHAEATGTSHWQWQWRDKRRVWMEGWDVPFYRLFYTVSKYGPAMRHRWLFRGHMHTVGSFRDLPGVMDSISPFVPQSTRVGNNH